MERVNQRLVLRRNPDYAWGPPFYDAPETGIIEEIDPTSFVTTQSISSVKGGMVKERKVH